MQKKYKMDEDEHRVSCPIHCKASTMNINGHPLLEKKSSECIIIQAQDNEEAVNLPEVLTFSPDYERIKYAIDGIKNLRI